LVDVCTINVEQQKCFTEHWLVHKKKKSIETKQQQKKKDIKNQSIKESGL
jgi:hypothetical protein